MGGMSTPSRFWPSARAIRCLCWLRQRHSACGTLARTTCRRPCRRSARWARRRLTWHFIGQVQSNKTRDIATRFDWVHTIDRVKIAQRLAEQRPPRVAPLQVCIQVRLDAEPQRGGVAPADAATLVATIRGLPQLQLRGLMCVPPAADDLQAQRRWFAAGASAARRLWSGLPRAHARHAVDGHERRPRSRDRRRRDDRPHRYCAVRAEAAGLSAARPAGTPVPGSVP